jgi:hypothetical protein
MTLPTWLFTIITLASLSLSGCNSTRNSVNSATATIRAQRSNDLATKQANLIRGTRIAQRQYATATVQAVIHEEDRRSRWPLLFLDSYLDNTHAWPTGEESGDLVDISMQVDGTYRWKALAKEGFIYWSRPDIMVTQDFYLGVDVKEIDGTEDGQYGLMFRQVDNDNFYIFKVNQRQQYIFERSTIDGWQTILDWSETPAIKPDETNHLEVSAIGPDFIFFINGQFINQAFDESLQSGKTGVMIGIPNAGEEVVIDFDNFEIRSPDISDGVP